ncbi:MAG: HAMP domain-containing sensor histidine kinase [Desulfobacteraceae bacterium]|jgi:signal transduction histidine kinase|nr:HAMP domain-containing sensor histidine kinase [Desulfobacteraceae bacterium]
MTFRHSLRSRIIIAFCLFGAILGLLYATGVYISLDAIDDHLIDSRLQEEVDNFVGHYQRYKTYPQPTSPYITAYVGTHNMPLFVQNMIAGLSEGFHEANTDEEEYHIAIQSLQGREKRLYLLYEVSALEFTEKRKTGIRIVLIAGFALIIGLGLWIGWLTSRKVIAPVVHLSDLINKSGPDNLPTDFSKAFYDDEVGVLANALEQAMKRVEMHVEREYRFSRYASHELRTPVTIIKGAVGLLKKKLAGESDPAYRPLKRIERAVTNMGNIIETLLWLSREDEPADQTQVLDVAPLVRETMEQNRHLLTDKPVDLELAVENTPRLSIPAPVFQIMLTNLIRNAIQYTSSGKICVNVMNDRISVSDTGIGMHSDDLKSVTRSYLTVDRYQGYGLGLSIVKRLCERLGWRLKIESKSGRGTNAQLIFS